MRHALLLAFATLLLLPGATAQTGTWAFEFASPGLLVLTVDAKFQGEAASGLRSQIDDSSVGGDGDGRVTQEEVNDFTITAITFLNAMGAKAVSGAGFMVDGKAPDRIQFKVLDFKGAPGVVTSTAEIGLRAVADVRFPVKAASRHELTVEPASAGEGYFDAVVDKATLRAPRNYVIEGTQGLPAGAAVSEDKRSIAFSGSFQAADTMTVTIVRSGGTSPSTAFLGVVVAALVAVLATRRRPLA